MRPLIIYHGNCADGFTAAWAAHRYFKGECELYEGKYGETPPDVAGRVVILVDFSYKRDVMVELSRQAYSILVLDHHKSAYEDLVQTKDANTWRFTDFQSYGDTYEVFLGRAHGDRESGLGALIYCYFDMARSGAGITWDFFFPGEKRPELINIVEHRDLWKFSDPPTDYDVLVRRAQASIFSFVYDLTMWDTLVHTHPQFLAQEGAAIERKHFKDLAELLKVTTRWMVIDGHRVPVANLPYTMSSDAANNLCVEHKSPFAACYWDVPATDTLPAGRQFSLRSLKPKGADVSIIAAKFGGGGHKHAAGFRVSFYKAQDFEP
jgi:oligoribonuclease NrnB/cAMP/cGMP phosphodiesterase (DHH superfamily)